MSNLNHIVKKFNNDKSMILVLDRGSYIKPEAEAMLQAMYSRSPNTVFNHLDIVEKRGADAFMSTYYVEYGHASIGDCADATLFIEGVSMLAAKAIQDNRLYSGQEVSTRYVDFCTQRFENVNDEDGKVLHEYMRDFYIESLSSLINHLSNLYPKKEDEKESVWNKAIKAKAFDILRGFLPAGATTSVAWHSNLRQFRAHLITLLKHPLEEVRDIAVNSLETLHISFPNSGFDKIYDNEKEYAELYMRQYYFEKNIVSDEFTILYEDNDELNKYKNIFEAKRDRRIELPKYIENATQIRYDFSLDFGSYRDIQRHRAVLSRMPRLSLSFGFESWYIDNLPQDIRIKAEELLKKVEIFYKDSIEKNKNIDILQYFIPMGYKVPITITGGLHSMTYLAERRATPDVHITLQKKARFLAEKLNNHFEKYGYKATYTEKFEDFNIKRGSQDILKKDQI